MGTHRLLLRLSAILFVLAWCQGSGHAEKRLAVLEIEGSRTPALRKDVVRLLEPNVTMSAQAYRNAAKRLRARKLTPKNIKRVARYLEADGVVDGTLDAVGGRYRLVLRIRSGKSGVIVKKITLKLAKPRLSPSIERKLQPRLQEGVAALSGALPKSMEARDETIDREDEPEDRVEDEREQPSASERVRRRRERLRVRRSEDRRRDDDFEDDDMGDDDDEDDEFDDEDFDEDDAEDEFDGENFRDVDTSDERSDRPRKKSGGRPPSFVVFAGTGTMQRNLSFTVEPSVDPPPAYEGSFVPTAYVAGELYPLALSEGASGLAANLGITGSYERALSISTTAPDGSAQVDTSMERFRVGALLRHVFGSSASSPSVALTVGYNVQKFAIDKGASATPIEIPNVEYKYVDPGLVLRYPEGKLTFFADVRGVLILDAGEIQEQSQYGPATVTGVDGDVGFEYALGDNFMLRFGGRVTYIGYVFQGGTPPANMLDRNGDMLADVPGASDRYLGGYGALGIRY